MKHLFIISFFIAAISSANDSLPICQTELLEKLFAEAPATFSYQELPVSAATLFAAHRTGFLPDRGNLWSLPTTRGIVSLRGNQILRGSRQTISQLLRQYPNLKIFFNRASDNVIDGCAQMERDSSPWLTPEVVQGYKQLAKKGSVFSVELWDGERLIAGNFGIYSNGHVQGISRFRDLSHPASNGGGTLVTEAERVYLAMRGLEFQDVEVDSVNGKAKIGVESMPRDLFAAWLKQQNSTSFSLFEGAQTNQPAPMFEFDFRSLFQEMVAARSYGYPVP